MCKIKLNLIIKVVTVLLFYSSYMLNAEEKNKKYELNAFVGVGYNRFISGLQEEGLNKNGYNGTLRFMWTPEYLLRVGLETGYVKLFSVNIKHLNTEFGNTYLKTKMSAIPIFIIWSMDLGKKIDINITTSSDNRLVMSVKDDGVGFSPVPETKKGMGLNIIKCRARMIGASLSISKGPEGGTIVECNLKL